MLRSVPAGRMGEVEENANLAAYLLSDYSSWVSGAVVVLDGGNLPYMAGMFSQLTQVTQTFLFPPATKHRLPTVHSHGPHCLQLSVCPLQVTKEQWDMMESMIRQTKGS